MDFRHTQDLNSLDRYRSSSRMEPNTTNSMASRRESAQNYLQSSTPLSTSHTSSTSATSGEPLTPLDQYSLWQNLSSYDSPAELSSTSASYKGMPGDCFLGQFVPQEPLTWKQNSDGVQNGQSPFDVSNVYSNKYHQQFQPTSNGNWSASPASITSPPVPRKVRSYSSRKFSGRTNSNLSYTSSSTSTSQSDRFPPLTPLTTPGELDSCQDSSQDFPFYSNAINFQTMSPTQSPLDSLDSFPQEPKWDDDRSYRDMTPAQNFADATSKRTRAEGRSDAISACWTSPLCPNHTDPRDGTPPNPATCGGGCAPFLFGEEPLPEGFNDAAMDLPVVAVEQVTMVSRPRSQQQKNLHQNQQPNKPKVQRVPKRWDTDTKHEDQGRNLSKATNNNLKQSSPPEANITDSIETTKKATRQPHNKVEQKYRDSINNQMEALRKVVPALSESARACLDDTDIEDLPIPSRPSKAVILASATAFIKVQTKEKRHLEAENVALRQRVQSLQALLRNKCDDCSLMQSAIGMNLRNGTKTGQWPLSFLMNDQNGL